MGSPSFSLPTILSSELNPKREWIVLGRGTTGKVYKARFNDSDVAVKVYDYYHRDEIDRERAAYEDIGNRSLHVVHVHGHGIIELSQEPFIVREYTPHGSLDTYLENYFSHDGPNVDSDTKKKTYIISDIGGK
eukprot:TRINITY_DN21831_c0_g1_i1.p3 TRINITY_DN21831_c0_g1~~TRINITY_DN21831_c0_g1_i1.p3  ORF type:complete len:133 (-),score=17.83 TRINITY_DN21831_c0_g1_i1:874-1272(-)